MSNKKITVNINNFGGVNTNIGVNESTYSQKTVSVKEVCNKILFILSENEKIWEEFGPESSLALKDPANENAAEFWSNQKKETIIPNNKSIISLLNNNSELFNDEDIEVFNLFKLHCYSFEASCYNRQEKQIRFPIKFKEVIKKYGI